MTTCAKETFNVHIRTSLRHCVVFGAPYFFFGMSQVWTSAHRLAILAQVYCGFPQALNANAGIVP